MFGSMARSMVHMAAGFTGGGLSVTVRRSHSMQGVSRGESRGLLEFAAPAAAGATTWSLRRPGGGSLQGLLPAGLVLTVAGQGYALASDAAANGGTALAVSVAAGLAAPAAAGDQVLVAPYLEATFVNATVSDIDNRMADGERLFVGDQLVHIPAPEVVTVTPMADDQVLWAGQSPRAAQSVATTKAGVTPISWSIHLRGGRP